MTDKTQLLYNLEQINLEINDSYKELKDLGLLSGMSGIVLFKFYYSKLLDDDSLAEEGLSILTECINKINEGYNYPTFCSGLAVQGGIYPNKKKGNSCARH